MFSSFHGFPARVFPLSFIATVLWKHLFYESLCSAAVRVLKVFLSRTAQRIPYMTSWRVMRLLGIILLIVCWFLVAWTSAVCQNPDKTVALIDVGYTPDGLQFGLCLLDRWDYMMAVGKFHKLFNESVA